MASFWKKEPSCDYETRTPLRFKEAFIKASFILEIRRDYEYGSVAGSNIRGRQIREIPCLDDLFHRDFWVIRKAKMELVDKANVSNDFGLRKKFPWNGLQNNAPWLEDATDSEISYIRSNYALRGTSIKRIENPYLWARYMLQYEEFNADESKIAHEHIVIHATSDTNALKIADENFNWRCVRRGRFGQGVSFSKTAGYANKYASQKNVYIIAGILISKRVRGSYTTIIPPGDYDTTVDSIGGNVYVKYYDSEFYPYYIVH
ncbi:protein mono-ADP-ribosyltransferase PARP14-like isoform X1 [Neodiprion virginianus]|uniref:protein mono-ADP-ribosyltransferase PARP14-like isoform X1 n=1 Tax=Neodiprion virginianus TaxID=2961670 RepID=UPI001EE731C6|nr:protein mono-ADP-ribosyltransferase PARP14-like isoform X1 [Neodiprion virginianus]